MGRLVHLRHRSRSTVVVFWCKTARMWVVLRFLKFLIHIFCHFTEPTQGMGPLGARRIHFKPVSGLRNGRVLWSLRVK